MIRPRTVIGVCLAVAAVPLAYQGWSGARSRTPHRSARARAARRIRESIRLEKPLDEVFRRWQRLENLPGALTVEAVSFSAVRNGRSTEVSAYLRSPRIREQLRRLKQVLEAGEIARTATTRA